MQEMDKLGKVMEIFFENCDDCPLEKICEADCDVVWQAFFNTKVKEDGIETCRN